MEVDGFLQGGLVEDGRVDVDIPEEAIQGQLEQVAGRSTDGSVVTDDDRLATLTAKGETLQLTLQTRFDTGLSGGHPPDLRRLGHALAQELGNLALEVFEQRQRRRVAEHPLAAMFELDDLAVGILCRVLVFGTL